MTATPPSLLLPSWLERIDRVTATLKEKWASAPDGWWWLRPAPDQWSAAEVLDHLIRINRSYYPLVEEATRGNLPLHPITRLPFLAKWLGQFILKSVAPDRQRRMKTFPVWEPVVAEGQGDPLAEFVRQQEVLKAALTSWVPLMEKDKLIFSPANKAITYPLRTAAEIIVTHEERHLAQCLEILERCREEN